MIKIKLILNGKNLEFKDLNKVFNDTLKNVVPYT